MKVDSSDGVGVKDALPSLRSNASETRLLPAQSATMEALDRALTATEIVALTGLAGMGRTTIARALVAAHGGKFIDATAATAAMRRYPPRKWEEALYDLVSEALRRDRLVVIDDFPRLAGILCHARGTVFREVMMPILRAMAGHVDARLVLIGGSHTMLWDDPARTFGEEAALVECKPLTIEDYRAFFERRFGKEASAVDARLIHRFAPGLNCYQLDYLCGLIEHRPQSSNIDTDLVVELLEQRVLKSNIRLREVEPLRFEQLPGAEHIAEALETHVVLPFQNRALAEELKLKPRRGVLLYGPPGTGKTSIGRALAHRIKGKFFLIDGTVVTEPPSHFFGNVASIVAEAKANAPCVLFIDDADVLFGIEHIAGLSRYLLSLLDGLESETASNVCVMMTAMDPARIPAALLRSGRVELWLETKTPDAALRARILERWMAQDLPGHDTIEYAPLADATEGFTPADLRRLAGDAKLLYAADHVAGAEPRTANAYLNEAIADLNKVRSAMAELVG